MSHATTRQDRGHPGGRAGGPDNGPPARLQQQGVAVTVYERDARAQARVWGGTLDLHEETGQPALREAGLLADYFAQARSIGRTLVDEQCRVLLTTPPNTATPEINRYALRQLLLASLAPDTVQWGHKFTRLNMLAGRWQLHFEGSPPALADVAGPTGGCRRPGTSLPMRRLTTRARLSYRARWPSRPAPARPSTSSAAATS